MLARAGSLIIVFFLGLLDAEPSPKCISIAIDKATRESLRDLGLKPVGCRGHGTPAPSDEDGTPAPSDEDGTGGSNVVGCNVSKWVDGECSKSCGRGLAAGMFGIGGGIVKGPLMLEMNVYAPVTSATSATMILFTSTGASVSYLLFEQLNLHYGVILFCLGIVWTLFGQIALNKVVKASGRNSYIILIIGLTVALSAIAMGVESSGALIDLFKGHAEGGGDLCGAGGE